MSQAEGIGAMSDSARRAAEKIRHWIHDEHPELIPSVPCLENLIRTEMAECLRDSERLDWLDEQDADGIAALAYSYTARNDLRAAIDAAKDSD